MSSTKIAPSPPYGLPVPQDGRGSLTNVHPTTGSVDREHLLDRLHHLRGILPMFAQELATARRQAAALRVENRGLLEEVRRLRAQHDERASRQR